MAGLRVRLFGTVRIVGDDEAEIRLTRMPEALLAYLVLRRHRLHARDALAGIFWPDLSQDRARSALNTALWRLRRSLEPTRRGMYLVTTPGGDVGFDTCSDYWLDVEVFERSAVEVVRPGSVVGDAQAERLEACTPLYQGDLLEGYYHDWAFRERERLRMLWLEAMTVVMRYHCMKGSHEKALLWGQRILQVDPLQEGVHRRMIRIYLQSGERALALRHYERCCELIESELGVAPMEETRALYVKIVPHASVEQRSNGISTGSSGTVQAAMQIVDEAMGDLRRARERLRQAEAAVQAGWQSLGRSGRPSEPSDS